MGGAALAQVDLDGVGRPAILLAGHHEVDREAADYAALAQLLRDAEPLPLDQLAVVLAGGKGAAEEHLPARAAEHLIVRR